MRPVRNAVFALIVAVAAVAAVACSGGSSSVSATSALREAPARTVAARTALVSFEVSSSAMPSATLHGDGAFDFAARRGRLGLDIPLGGSPQRVETVIDGNAVYAKLPTALSALATSTPWVRLDSSALGSAQAPNVSQALQYLRGATKNAKKVGTERVRGATTTHYKGTFDLDRAAAALSGSAKTDVQRAQSLLGSKSLPAEAWVDAKGRIRRMRLTAQQATVTFELYDFGTHVDIAAPPPDQVTDLNGLNGLGGQPAH